MTMVKISDCFHYIINLLCYVMKSAGRILKLDRCLEICRLCSAICKLARLADWTEQIQTTAVWEKYSAENYFTRRLIDRRNQEYSADLDFFCRNFTITNNTVKQH